VFLNTPSQVSCDSFAFHTALTPRQFPNQVPPFINGKHLFFLTVTSPWSDHFMVGCCKLILGASHTFSLNVAYVPHIPHLHPPLHEGLPSVMHSKPFIPEAWGIPSSARLLGGPGEGALFSCSIEGAFTSASNTSAGRCTIPATVIRRGLAFTDTDCLPIGRGTTATCI